MQRTQPPPAKSHSGVIHIAKGTPIADKTLANAVARLAGMDKGAVVDISDSTITVHKGQKSVSFIYAAGVLTRRKANASSNVNIVTTEIVKVYPSGVVITGQATRKVRIGGAERPATGLADAAAAAIVVQMNNIRKLVPSFR